MIATGRLRLLLQFLENSPKDPFLLFALAKEYEKSGDDETALSYYLHLAKEHPDYLGTYYHLGKLYHRRNTPAEAISVFRKGMEIAADQKDQHAWNELAAAKAEIED